MLPKSKRVNLTDDFKWVATGQKIETKFSRIFIKMGDNPFAKIGMAVSAKYFRKATHRHRVKRVISKAFESLYLSLPKGINMVALPKKGILEVKSAEVLEDLEKVLKREKVID